MFIRHNASNFGVDRICSTEKSVSICQTAQGHKPEDHSIILHQGENLKVLQSVEVFGAFIQCVSFIFPPCMAALSHRKPASTRTSHDSCCLRLLAIFMTAVLLREIMKVTLCDIPFITPLNFSKSMN